MAITIQCSCGKTLKVDEKHRGKKAKCPECGSLLLVEEQEAETAVQTEAPKKKKPVIDDDDDTGVKAGKSKKKADPDDDDEPETRKPIKKKAAKSNMMMYLIGGGCGGLLLLTCCGGMVGGGIWYFFFRGPSDDLIYVHDGCAGFVSIRFADGWKSQAVQDQLKKMPPNAKREMDDKLKEMETKGGFKIDDIERFTMIFRSFDNLMGGGKDFAMVMKTSRAMNPKKIVEAMAKEKNIKEKEVKHEGATIYLLEGGGRDAMAVHFPTDRIMLMAEKESVMKDILKASKKPAKHAALTRGVSMASSSKYVFVMAFEAPKKMMDGLPPQAWQQAPTFKDMTGVIVAGTLTKDLALEAVITFPSSDKAGKAKKEAEDGVTMVKGLAKMGGPQVPPAATKFMDSLKVEQRSSEVVITGKLELNFDGIPFNFPGGGFGGGPGPGPIGVGGGQRMVSVNNLKLIGLAMHSFHDAHKNFPNHAIRHPQTGAPLLSWRVAILPYIEQGALYNQIRRNEPWDSQHNRQFWNRMPNTYLMPGKVNDGRTYYQVLHGDRSIFPRANRPAAQFAEQGDTKMAGITDGTSNTIMIVEAGTSVNWMQPEDVSFMPNDFGVINRMGNHWGNMTFNVVMADGFVRLFRRSMNPNDFYALGTRNGGEVVQVP